MFSLRLQAWGKDITTRNILSPESASLTCQPQYQHGPKAWTIPTMPSGLCSTWVRAEENLAGLG